MISINKITVPIESEYAIMNVDTLSRDYILLDHLVSVNGAYINTGVIPTNHKIELKVNDLNYINDKHYLGCLNKDATNLHFTTFNNKYYIGIEPSKGEISAGSFTTGEHIVILNNDSNNTCKIDDTILYSGKTQSQCDSASLLIGGRKDVFNCDDIWFYYCKIWKRYSDSNILIRDFVPVERIFDGAVGFFDKISNQFYYSEGTEKYIAGYIE